MQAGVIACKGADSFGWCRVCTSDLMTKGMPCQVPAVLRPGCVVCQLLVTPTFVLIDCLGDAESRQDCVAVLRYSIDKFGVRSR